MKLGISLRTSDRLPDDQVDAERRRAEDQPDYRQEVEPPVAFTKRRTKSHKFRKRHGQKEGYGEKGVAHLDQSILFDTQS
jgi:hypothetical protein